MQEITKFPLLCGNISIDLVNTEVVRRGHRLDLLPKTDDIWDWLHAVQADIPFWSEMVPAWKEQLPEIHKKLVTMRGILRAHFEAITDKQTVPATLITYLENMMTNAPITYKLKDEKLLPFPVGTLADRLLTILALDALKLIADGKLRLLKRCSNTDCVLLFIDESGRRKWCSMKICGNRKKVAKFQQRKTEEL
ncbi:MAG: CGNR zinc finger domain-containing protein [Solibacillus sp.]